MSNYQSFGTAQKFAILKQVEESKDKKRELLKLGIPRSTYYEWKANGGINQSKAPKTVWNKTPKEIEEKIKTYRKSGDPFSQSPARIVEKLEVNEGYVMTESGVKSVLVRNRLNGFLRPKKKIYSIRPKAEKFLQVVCADGIEFTRYQPSDTHILNFTDEASYFALHSKVFGRRIRAYDIVDGLKAIKETYGRYPKTLRLDNAKAHWAKKVIRFCKKKNIKLDHITAGCPEENWPVESWHRNLNQDLIYRRGYDTVGEWQKSIDEYRLWHNTVKRLRRDPIKRTPIEIATGVTSPMTQARVKITLQRKIHGQTSVDRFIHRENFSQKPGNVDFTRNFVSEMCES